MAEMNYYAWLGVPADTDTDEIVRILDDRYRALQMLATHPDSAKVRQAEADREVVEQVRAVLADPIRRQVYDLTLAGAAGGLADPTAMPAPQPPRPGPPRPKAGPPAVVAGPAGGQPCPKCGTVNDVGNKHCLKCGTALLKSCPSCQHNVPYQAVYCPNCSVNIADFLHQQEVAEQQRLEAARRQAEVTAQLGPLQQTANSASKWTFVGYGCGIWFYVLGAFPFWLVGLRKARAVLNAPRVPGDEAIRAKADRARRWSIIGLSIPLIVAVVYLLVAITQM